MKTKTEQPTDAAPKVRPSRWRIALHLWAGVCLKAAADVSGMLKARGGSSVEEAQAAATGAVIVTVLLYAVGYYLSYQLASTLDRTGLTPSKRKAILIALPFAYFALAVILGGTVGILAGTAQ
jgi:hypothetical protein